MKLLQLSWWTLSSRQSNTPFAANIASLFSRNVLEVSTFAFPKEFHKFVAASPDTFTYSVRTYSVRNADSYCYVSQSHVQVGYIGVAFFKKNSEKNANMQHREKVITYVKRLFI